MNHWIQDFRLALRRLRKNPGFTFTAVVILALGLGATTVLFSVLHAVLLEPLPYPEGDRIYRLQEIEKKADEAEDAVSAPTFRDWKESLESFSALAAIRFNHYNLTGVSEPQHLRAARVNSDFFSVFGPEPVLGRRFTAEENRGQAERVVLINSWMWQHQLGGREDVLGAEVELNGQVYSVVGVMPSGFTMPSWADVWLPLGDVRGEDRSARGVTVYGKLASNRSPEAAAAELETLAGRLSTAHPATHEDLRIRMTQLLEEAVGEVRPTLWLLFGAVGAVLLIVCLNVAGLALAQGLERRRELALRSALGAGRQRVMQEMLTESLVLASLGGAAGVLLAQWGFDLILALAPSGIPRLNEVAIDGPVLAFALAATLLTALVAGWLPAHSSTRFQLDEVLRTDRQGSPGRGSGLRRILVVAQVALTVVLLASAGLLIGSLQRLLDVELGFDADRVLSVGVVLPYNLYPEESQKVAFVDEVRRELESLPQVERAGVGNALPWSFSGNTMAVEAVDGGDTARFQGEALERVVSEGFFETLGVKVLAGRPFGSVDRAQGRGGVEKVLVNETLARRAWPNLERPPLGQRIEISSSLQEAKVVEVIGVVQDVRYGGPAEPAGAQLFRFYAHGPWEYFNIAVRSAAGTSPGELFRSVRRAVWQVDANRPIFGEQTAMGSLAGVLERPRFSAVLLAAFALVALVLAAVGVYGVMAFMVHRRGREIGIRMALGARRREVRAMVLRQGFSLVMAGVVLGVPAALLAAQGLRGLLFEVSPWEPGAFALALLVLGGAGWLAIHLPASRASRIEPMQALRED